MNKDFSDIMSKKTDEEIIGIVMVDYKDYQPLAVQAAEDEIKKRGIDSSRLQEQKEVLLTIRENQAQLDSTLANRGKRLVHFLVDSIVFWMAGYLISTPLILIFRPSSESSTMVISYIGLIIGFFGYYVFTETKFQKTIGKFITKTKVVTKEGTRPTVSAIMKRTFFRLIPLDRLSFLVSAKGIHDRFSDTMVVRDEI